MTNINGGKVLSGIGYTWEHPFTPEQQRIYRADEAGFLTDFEQVAERYNVIERGDFIPGDAVCYAAVYVIRELRDEYVTHLMYRMDDQEGPVRWAFTSGRYFNGLDSQALAAARADLLRRV